MIRVYDEAGNVIETYEHTGRFQRVVAALSCTILRHVLLAERLLLLFDKKLMMELFVFLGMEGVKNKVNDGLLNPLPEKVLDLEEYVKAHVPEAYRYYLLHQRGYAQRFDWVGPDRERAKREKEQSIVEDWVAGLYRDNCPYVGIESCEPPLPDCQLIDKAGQKIGVEVSELVDQATIERNRYTSYHWKVYSPEELFSATKAILIAKDQKLVRARAEIQCAGFGKIIVLLHCDEPDLHSQPAFCRKVFASQDFQPLTEIDEAFLLLPCPRKKNLHDFEAEYCQPIRIPIPPKISAG